MYCSNCGKENNKKVCSSCGVKQGKVQKYCTWCGSELQENASICTNCNEKTKKNVVISIGAFVLDAFFMLMFFVHLFDNETYRTALLYLVVFLGLAIAFPIWRSVINKKTHENQKMRTPLKIARYLLIVILIATIYNTIIPMGEYNFAVKTAENEPIEARKLFLALEDYKDADAKANEMADIIFNSAKTALDNKDWKKAEELLKNIPEYNKNNELKTELMYQKGVSALENYQYALAKHCFEDIGDYKDVSDLKKNIGIGLAGNNYNYTLTTYRPVQVSSYSWYFNDNWHEEDSPATARQFVVHTPKIYAAGMDLDVDSIWQYRIINNTFYGTSDKIKAPENLEEWVVTEKISDIEWANGEIISFKMDGMKYTIKE